MRGQPGSGVPWQTRLGAAGCWGLVPGRWGHAWQHPGDNRGHHQGLLVATQRRVGAVVFVSDCVVSQQPSGGIFLAGTSLKR